MVVGIGATTSRQAVLETTAGDHTEGPLVAMPNLAESAAEKYDSVQFVVRGTTGIHQFKLRCLPEVESIRIAFSGLTKGHFRVVS